MCLWAIHTPKDMQELGQLPLAITIPNLCLEDTFDDVLGVGNDAVSAFLALSSPTVMVPASGGAVPWGAKAPNARP